MSEAASKPAHSPGPWTRSGWFIHDANGVAILVASSESAEVDEANLTAVVELQAEVMRLRGALAGAIPDEDADQSGVEIHRERDLQATALELRNALEQLLAKLDAIEAHPEFKSVFTLHMIHGGRYAGPNWKDEYEAARAALAKAGAPHGQ